VSTCGAALSYSQGWKVTFALVLSLLFYDNICQNQVHEDKIFDSMFIR